jgi:hypothetical protein
VRDASAFKRTFGTSTTAADWQNEAWTYVKQVGELDYYVRWRASSVSRCRLVASELDDRGMPIGGVDQDNQGAPTPEGVLVQDIINGIGGSGLGAAKMLRRIAYVLSVPGECWVAMLVRTPAREQSAISATPDTVMPRISEPEQWFVFDRSEIRAGATEVTLLLPDGMSHVFDPSRDLMFRVWDEDPRTAWLPTSPVYTNRDALNEIVRATAAIDNASKSRLIGNGIIFVPQEISLPQQAMPVPTPPDGAADPPTPLMVGMHASAQEFQDLLYDVATAAMKDPDSVAATLPLIASAPGDQIKNVQWVRAASDVPATALTTRDAAVRRLAMGLDVSPERLLGVGGHSNHWCVDEITEILTQRGWLKYTALRVGDIALTLNHDTGLSEWHSVLDIYRAVVVDEPMMSMETRTHSSLTTAAHRWAVVRPRGTPSRGTGHMSREFVRSTDLRSSHQIPTAAVSADLPTVAKYSDELVELVAWYWTEGSISGRGLTIAQPHMRNPHRVERIRACLHRAFGPASVTLQGSSAPAWRENIQPNRQSLGGPVTTWRLNVEAARAIRDVVPDKIVNCDFVRDLTAAQLELFIDVSAQGDGQHYRSGSLDMWQRESAAVDAYELALLLSGRMVQRQQIDEGHRVGVWQQTSVQPLKAAMNPTPAYTEITPYSGVVWCPVTSTGTWFARRNGKSYYTGNSAWQIEETDVKVHIVPLVEMICAALTEQILRPKLISEGIDPEKYVIWYDSTDLTQDPDKRDAAQTAYDRGAITSQSLRDYLGLEADDGYDLESTDGWLQMIMDRIAANPAINLPVFEPLLRTLLTGKLADMIPDAPPSAPAIGAPAGAPTTPGDAPSPQQEPSAGPPMGDRASKQAPQVSAAGLTVARLCVNRALELAAKRRRTRSNAALFRDIPIELAHTVLGRVDAADVPALIKGWSVGTDDDDLRQIGLDPAHFQALVQGVSTLALVTASTPVITSSMLTSIPSMRRES